MDYHATVEGDKTGGGMDAARKTPACAVMLNCFFI